MQYLNILKKGDFMEEKIVELLTVLNELNNSQEKVFGEINYTADDEKKFEISIRQKQTFKYIEKCNVSLANYPIEKLNAIISILKNYYGGIKDE